VGWECRTLRENKNAYKILIENPGGKRPLGRPRHSKEDNNKMYSREIG
jgi:hypothetical protein